MKCFGHCLIAASLGFFAGTAQAAKIAGFRSDAQEVFETGRGDCALAARTYQAQGQSAVVILTQVTSENAKLECPLKGKVYGVYFNCSGSQTSEQKAFSQSGTCTRQVNAEIKEQIYIDGLTGNLRIIQRNYSTGKNKYLNLYNSRRLL